MIYVVGGSGFIGSRLCKSLSAKGRSFRIIDKRKSKAFPEDTALADIRFTDQLKNSIGAGDAIIHLAAEHRDDVRPRSLYDEVNVQGARNICAIAEDRKVNHIIFTSSVAVYGFAPAETKEDGKINYFNDYGRTKWLAEEVLRAWQLEDPANRTLTIIRPTVVFGEKNRGNVYNLLRQIATGRFLMIGEGRNRKSMAYVENVAEFIIHALGFKPGVHTYNYIDKPDLDMVTLVDTVRRVMGMNNRKLIRIPYALGLMAGYAFDIAAAVTGKRLAVSSIRVRKFCATTQFGTSIGETGFTPPVSLAEGLNRTVTYEFVEHHGNEDLFYTE